MATRDLEVGFHLLEVLTGRLLPDSPGALALITRERASVDDACAVVRLFCGFLRWLHADAAIAGRFHAAAVSVPDSDSHFAAELSSLAAQLRKARNRKPEDG